MAKIWDWLQGFTTRIITNKPHKAVGSHKALPESCIILQQKWRSIHLCDGRRASWAPSYVLIWGENDSGINFTWRQYPPQARKPLRKESFERGVSETREKPFLRAERDLHKYSRSAARSWPLQGWRGPARATTPPELHPNNTTQKAKREHAWLNRTKCKVRNGDVCGQFTFGLNELVSYQSKRYRKSY